MTTDSPREDKFGTRSMLFTIYGDYVIYRGGEIWVGSLIKLLEQFDLSEQAVRSALSRMCRKGWLAIRKVGINSYYSLSPKGEELLTKGRVRIFGFQKHAEDWDGTWYILSYSIPEEKRDLRERLRKQLSWLGYGPLSYGTWISPHGYPREVEEIVRSLEIQTHVELFAAEHLGFSTSREMVARCWDLAAINDRYRKFVAKYAPRCKEFGERLGNGELSASDCFVERTLLIHEYRRFPLIDPELPSRFLPADWEGRQAGELFETYHGLLADKANSFFDRVFEAPPEIL